VDRQVPRRLAAALATGVALLVGTAPAQAASTKVVVIVMENHSYASIVGSPDAPYINSLIAQGKLFTAYRAVQGASLPNYLAMTSGLTTALSPPSPNVFQAMDATGGAETWTEYEESMKSNCGVGSLGVVPGTTTKLYTHSHDPDYQYRDNTTCLVHDVRLTATSFNAAALPNLSYVVPNQCDDMHTLPTGGQACPAYYGPNQGTDSVQMGDNWLSVFVPPLLAQPDVTVLVTWDEGSATSKHVVTVEAGANVPSSTDATSFNHYNLEAGLYQKFGLGTAPNNGASATPLPIP
jgi:phosphatidylinositol-3-phosphatase